jgi:hypothetical protein
MSAVVAIVLASAILAAAILVTFRWEISAPNYIYVLDRWTGNVSICTDSATDHEHYAAKEAHKGIALNCRP